MFVIALKPMFTSTVEFDTAGEDGKRVPGSITFNFRRHTQSEIDAILAEEDMNNRKFVERVAAGWSEAKDEAGNAAEFSVANLGVLLDIPGMPQVICEHYFEANRASPRKN